MADAIICPVCGEIVRTVTRGRTEEDGPVDRGQLVIDWIAVHLAGTALTAEQEAFLRAAYVPDLTLDLGARAAWAKYRQPPGSSFTESVCWPNEES
jgi:hypothetical protein